MDKAERTRQWVDSSECRVAGSSDALDAGAFVSAAERTAMVASFRQCMRKYRAEKVTDCDALSARLLANHPEARGNVLAARIFASFSARGDGALDVTDWTNACAVLAPSGSYVDKARAGFRAYDVDGDGVVDDSDLRTTLRAVLGSGTSDTQVDRIVDQLKTRFDVNGDGVLEEREFAQLLTKDDIAQRFTMRLH